MSGYWRFFREEAWLLTFGLSFTFFSSFGQTFLVSLFVPHFLEAFGLGPAGFGSLYAAATLASAALLPWAGRWLDRMRLTRYSVAVVILMAVSSLVLATAHHVMVLGLALVGIRLAGQGLASQTAMTAMARYYESARGKALSISNLGFPLGEGVLPLVAVGALALLGWRWSWVVVALLSLGLFAPVLVALLRRSGKELDPRRLGDAVGARGVRGGWNRREVLGDARFWWILPGALLPPFWATGLFLYQTNIAGLKGWSVSLMATAFVAFALTRVVCSLVGGGLVDRFSARQVFPFALLPLALAMGLLVPFDGPWVPFAFMASLGVSLGLTGTAKAALWAELYGIRHLGAIKSMMAAFMVVSTAASPVLVGWVMEDGAGFDALMWAGVGSVVAGAALAGWGLRARTGPSQ
jgi:MFS family permease